jgi:hypothetical protein
MLIDDETYMKIELSFGCQDLPNMDKISLTDSACVVFLDENGTWKRIGNTEVITDNLNPKFVKTVVINYCFEKKQNLMIKVYDVDNFDPHVDVAQNEIGCVKFWIHEILKSHDQTLLLPISNEYFDNKK